MRTRKVKAMAILLAAALFPIGNMPVDAAKGNNIQMKKKLTVEVGKTKKLKVTGKKIKRVIFVSTKKKIATVTKKGVIRGKKAGKCKVKATVIFGRNSKKVLTCKVTVSKTGKVQEEAQSTTTPSPIPYDGTEFDKSFAKTSLELLKNATMKDIEAGKNVMISPESVINALGMTMNGADGETLEEMKNIFCPNMTVDEFNQGMADFNTRLLEDKNVKFHIANSMWFNQNPLLKINDDFKSKNSYYYRAEIFEEVFNNETVGKVNDWVSKNTNKMIPNILNNMDAYTMAILLNAIAFEGEWADQYKDGNILKDQKFTNASGVEENATMLSSMGMTYLKDDHAKGFVKSYAGGNFSFVAMLPDEGTKVSDYVNSLTDTKLQTLINNPVSADVFMKLPEFKYDYDLSLVEALKNMGMKKAFAPEAQFTKLGTHPDGLYVGDVLHKTHIELDKNGTKAAAATAVIIKATSAAPVEREKVYIYLDRPFFYAIVDTKTGLPVFTGVVNSVK